VPEAQGQLHCFVSAGRTSCLNRTDASMLQRGRPAARRARRRTRCGRKAGAARLPAVLALRLRSSSQMRSFSLLVGRIHCSGFPSCRAGRAVMGPTYAFRPGRSGPKRTYHVSSRPGAAPRALSRTSTSPVFSQCLPMTKMCG
jgi:hypothetical protein